MPPTYNAWCSLVWLCRDVICPSDDANVVASEFPQTCEGYSALVFLALFWRVDVVGSFELAVLAWVHPSPLKQRLFPIPLHYRSHIFWKIYYCPIFRIFLPLVAALLVTSCRLEIHLYVTLSIYHNCSVLFLNMTKEPWTKAQYTRSYTHASLPGSFELYSNTDTNSHGEYLK